MSYANIILRSYSSAGAAGKMSAAEIRQRLMFADEVPVRSAGAPLIKDVAPVVDSAKLLTKSYLNPPSRAPLAYARPSYYDVDEMLANSCPSQEDMLAIRRDFNIAFDSRIVAPWTCTREGTESSTMLTVYNAFRAMRLIEFDAPMPLLNTTNLYEWLHSLNLSVIYFSQGDTLSFADAGRVTIRGELLDSSVYRVWIDPRAAVGLGNILLLFVHEGRHANPQGSPNTWPDGMIHHTCVRGGFTGADDISLEYGGAWAAQYWTARWFAEHSGHYLSNLEKRFAADSAAVALERICDGRVP